MGFNIQLIFTGVCGYAPNSDWSKPKNSPTHLHIVMPDGRDDAMNHQDLGNHIPKHFPRLCIPRTCSDGKRSFEIVSIEDKRLRFALEFDSAAQEAANRFQAYRDGGWDPTKPPAGSAAWDVRWLPDLSGLLAPGHGQLHPTGLQNQRPKNVATRVRLDFGIARSHYGADMDWLKDRWRFPDTAGAKGDPRHYANQLEVTLTGVKAATLFAASLHGAANETPIGLPTTGADATLSLVFSNLCTITNPQEYLEGKELSTTWWEWVAGACHKREDDGDEAMPEDRDFPLLYRVVADLPALRRAYPKGVPTLVRAPPIVGTRVAECYGGTLLQ